MTPITDLQWEAYRLTNQEGLSLEDAAKEMGISPQELRYILYSLRAREPDLFTDISSDGRRFDHGVSRYGGWCEDQIEERF
jgi:hypothetical protein